MNGGGILRSRHIGLSRASRSVNCAPAAVLGAGREETAVGTQESADRIALVVSASESERARQAVTLHEGALQDLAALGLQLARAKRLIDRGDSGRGAQLVHACALSVDAQMAALRIALIDLRSPCLIEESLVVAIREHLLRLDFSQPMSCSVMATLDWRPSIAVETALYRVAQEALTNVALHSRARMLEVTLRRSGDNVHLAVTDDGVGFDHIGLGEDNRAWRQRGIVFMADRIHSMGGTFSITSDRDRGTTVRAALMDTGRPQ